MFHLRIVEGFPSVHDVPHDHNASGKNPSARSAERAEKIEPLSLHTIELLPAALVPRMVSSVASGPMPNNTGVIPVCFLSSMCVRTARDGI